MRKRKVVLFFGLLLMMSAFMNFGSKTNNIYAVKSINNTLKKEKIKKKIEINQKLLKTLYNKNIELKKWKGLVVGNKQNDFFETKRSKKLERLHKLIFIREKSLVSFQNEAVKKLANDLNENVSYTKHILEYFGWKKDVISFIFGKGKIQKLNVKFEKMGCCPELIIKISRKFNSKEEKCKFIDGLKDIISKENLKIFFNVYGGNNVCNMCIALI